MERSRFRAALAALAITTGLAGSPEASAEMPRLPDGRLEVAPMLGWVFFDRQLALANGFYYGGELGHHFVFNHPWVVMGAYAMAEGSLSNVLGERFRDVDVIVFGGGVTFGVRGLGRFLPIVRAGAGLIVADGTPSNLDIVARFQFHLGGGLRYYLLDWLVIRAEVRLMMHENLLFGAGSGQLGDVTHVIVGGGIGVAR